MFSQQFSLQQLISQPTSHCFLKTHAKIDCAPIEAFMPKFHERPSVLPCLLAYLLACCLYPLQTKERTLNAPRRRWVDVTRILWISFLFRCNENWKRNRYSYEWIIISTRKSKKREKMRKLKKLSASAGNRTRINCLEGSYADHYTTDALL